MKLLALDTSTEMCSAALWLDGDCLVRGELAGNSHSQRILPMVMELLAEAGLGLAELDGLAFAKGPGSFTGLRIGCGVVQGLALAADRPVLGVVTLEALAVEAEGDRIITCLDARMGEVYAAAYQRRGDGLECLHAPVVCPPGAVFQPEGSGWEGRGSGFAAYGAVLAGRLGDRLARQDAGAWPHARAVARLAAPRFAAEAGPADLAEPYYVRDKVALKTEER